MTRRASWRKSRRLPAQQRRVPPFRRLFGWWPLDHGDRQPRRAHDVGAQTIGLNIVLPHEQAPNEYVTPELSPVSLFRAAQDAFPDPRAGAGGISRRFRHVRRIFELLTLVQTGKIKPIPILLFGRDFWNKVGGF